VEHRVVVLDVSREIHRATRLRHDDLDIGLVVPMRATGKSRRVLKLDRQVASGEFAAQYDGASGHHPPFGAKLVSGGGRLDPRGGNGCGNGVPFYGE